MDYLKKEMLNMFKALSDEIRHDIFELLTEHEMNVTEICEQFNITQPTVSHHLQVLKNCNLVDSRKEGKLIYYFVKKEVVNDLFGNIIEKFDIEVTE